MPIRLVLFTVAGEEYALPVERVREVVRWQEPRSIGEPAPWLLGVVSLRGTLIRVADLALRLGLEPGPREQIVVFDSPEGPAGLAVAAVDTVAVVEDDQLSPSAVANRDVVAQIASIGTRLVVVLDPDGLLEPKPSPQPGPEPGREPDPERAALPVSGPPKPRRRTVPRRPAARRKSLGD